MAENTSPNKAVKNLLKGSGNIYRVVIINAAYNNRVATAIVTPDGTRNAPIYGAIDVEDDTQVVRIVRVFG